MVLLISDYLLVYDYTYRKPILPIEKEYIPSDSANDSDDMEEYGVERYCQDMCKLKKQLFSKADSNI